MEENLYFNLARANLFCSLKDRRVDSEEFKYLYRQLNDNELFSRMIFEIVRSLNKENNYTNIKDIIINERDFIDRIINCINEVRDVDIDIKFYSSLWMYLIFINQNNCFQDKMKGEYLSDISPSFYVDKYFMLEYYNSMMDNIMATNPIDVEKLNTIKNKVKEIM